MTWFNDFLAGEGVVGDPPEKKKSLLDQVLTMGGLFDPINEKIRALGPATVQTAKDEYARAKKDPFAFYLEQVGPGVLGTVTQRAGRPVIAKLLRELQAEGGATLEASGKRFAGKGYAVADPDLTTIVSNEKEMKAFLKRRDVLNALSAGKKIGKWTDPETGKTEINITDILETEKDAVKLAAQRGEQAVGNLGEGGEYLGDVRNPHAPVNAVKELLSQMRTGPQMRRVTEIPSTRGKQLAQAYESLPKNDPAAKEAYDALNTEVAKQFEAMEKAGYKVEFTDADPYKNSAEMMKDVRENKTLKVFKTPEGGEFHPYMTPEQNNRFRAVHDFLAHAGGGNQFGAVGEENAYRVHASTLSDLAKRALASETRGQNSWVNFGPNSHLPVKERPFAEQKAALFPEGLLGEYDDMGRAPATREQIAAAAIRDPETGNLHTGPAHMWALESAPDEATGRRLESAYVSEAPDAVGFVSNLGNFLSREKAQLVNRGSRPGGQVGPAPRKMDAADIPRGPAVKVGWKRTDRGVFDFGPERGEPATEYREPAPLPFESEPRAKAGPSELAQQIATDPRVEKRIVEDMDKGLGLGGLGWYGTLPLRRYFESIGNPQGFTDFNLAGGAGSIRTPTHNELTNISILRYAQKRGIPYEAAREEFLRRFPGTMRPTFMGIHGKVFDRALEAGGKMVPSSPQAGELKVPHYTHDRLLGAEGVPLDTHELRAMAQSLGLDEKLVRGAAVDAESYNLMTQPYRRVAQRYGLHPDQVQAGRWIGGGKRTGLKSQPQGDFMQTLEDGLLYTAQETNRDTSPRGLRSLWDLIAAGDEFFLPYSGEGGFPVPH